MKYRAKVMRPQLGLVSLEVVAGSSQDAYAQMVAQGYAVLSISPVFSLTGFPSLFPTKFPLLMFSQKFLVLMGAGMTQIEAIKTILDEGDDVATSNVIKEIATGLYEGKSLSAAMEKFPVEFPRLYIEMIRSSERTGDIGESLKQYIKYRNQIDSIRKKIINASIYPAILLTAGLIVSMFLLFYVVPKFSLIYQDIGHDLPFFSRLLMNFGKFCNDNVSLVLGAMLGLVFSLILASKRPSVRAWLLKQLKRVPTVGHQVHIYQLSLFYRTISMLLKGGLHILPTIDMVGGVLESNLKSNLILAKQSIYEGGAASASFERFGLTTPIALSLLRVGEKTGRLGDMSEYIANYYDEQTARWVEWFTKLFEPVLMSVIGIVIGLIVVMMYFPIFELAGSLQ